MKTALLAGLLSAFLFEGAFAATIKVTSTANNGPGTLREALANASDGDTIDATGVYGTILLGSGELLVDKSVTILGPGPGNLSVDGNHNSGVFHVQGGVTAVISGLTIAGGNLYGYTGGGGGIFNDHATLTVSNCTLSGNSARTVGGGICNDGAGGSATLTIANSTISGNNALIDYGVGQGGAIFNNGEAGGNATLTISNSTLSGNWAYDAGGGIFNDGKSGTATVTIVNSTLSGNSAGSGGSILNNGSGGSATLEVGDTILNAGASGGSISNFSGTVSSRGYNLSSDDGGGFLTATGDQINTDPLLGPLRHNGPPTLTHELLAGSPAIDAGDPNFTPPPFFDQRGPGFRRVVNGRIDIGAFEVQPSGRPRTCTVTSTADSGPGTLRDCLVNALDGDTIDATGVSGTILLIRGELAVDNSITILGPGPDQLAVDGNGYGPDDRGSRVFVIGPGLNVTIAGLTITNGLAYAEPGGGILNYDSMLLVSNCTFTGNHSGFGAGIFTGGFGSCTVVNSAFNRNEATLLGGAMHNDHSTLIVSNCTFISNGDATGNSIYNNGLDDCCATLSVSASTFTDAGDGIINASWTTLFASASTFISNSINNWIWNSSTGIAVVTTSTFSGGGGIGNNAFYSATAMLWVNACTFSGGGIGNNGTLEIGDTILNGSNTLNNSDVVVSHGYNISSDSGGGVLTNETDRVNTDAFLGPLQDNGGPTFTHALLCGSPALDAGKRDAIPDLALDTDQRGLPRPVGSPTVAGGDGSDIGAFEAQPTKVCAIRCPYDITSDAAPGMCGATVVFDVCSTGSCPSIVATPASGSFFNNGTTPVTVTTNGVTVGTFNVTVNDTEPPTITCPANIITNVGLGPTSAVVTFSDPVASDNCGVASTACSPPSGSTFGLGTNTVTCTALDTSGHTNSCAFEVIVLRPPYPDLTGGWIQGGWILPVHICKPISAGLQCKIKGLLIVQNIGTADAPNSFVRYYLSSDGVQTNRFLRKVATGTVKPGQPKKKRFSEKLPAGVNGSGQFILAVLDAGDAVTEYDESNNVVGLGPLP